MPKFPYRNGNPLWSAIEHRLTSAQQDALPEVMGLSERACGHRFNNPHLLTATDIEKLAGRLEMDRSTLVREYGCGHGTLTIERAQQIGVSLTVKA